MLSLYYKPGACSLAVHVLLRELGADFELKHFKAEEDALKKINPFANVPTIEDGDFHMREGGAILTWLCDEHQSELLPQKGAERAEALQWLMFANATLHPTYGRLFRANGMTLNLPDKNAILNDAGAKIQKCWDVIDEQLEGQSYICGEAFTVADILLTVIANWTPGLPIEVTFSDNLKAYFKRVSDRESFQNALDAEDVTYKAAA
mgnify:CR=1 FL=1